MFQLLKHCLVKQPAEEDPDEGIKELVEITLKKMVILFLNGTIIWNISIFASKIIQDLDHDSRLSLADFTESVKNEELLLEAFGKCLPDDDLIHVSFLSKIDYYPTFSEIRSRSPRKIKKNRIIPCYLTFIVFLYYTIFL